MNDEEQYEGNGWEKASDIGRRLGLALGSGARSVASGLVSLTPKGVAAITPSSQGTVMSVSVPEVAEGQDSDLSDLFVGPQETDNDIYIDDLVTFDDQDVADVLEVDEEEGVEDLLTVRQEDIMGPKPKPKVTMQKVFISPTGIRGI